MKLLTQDGKLKVNKITFKKLESSYDLEKVKSGEKGNRIGDVTLEAEVETSGTQE